MSKEEKKILADIRAGNSEIFEFIDGQATFSDKLSEVTYDDIDVMMRELKEDVQRLLNEIARLLKNKEVDKSEIPKILSIIEPLLKKAEESERKEENEEEEEKKEQKNEKKEEKEEKPQRKIPVFDLNEMWGKQPVKESNNHPYKKPAVADVQPEEINDIECICDCDFDEIFVMMDTEDLKKKLRSLVSKKLGSSESDNPRTITMKGDLKKYQIVEEINIADELGEWRFHPFFDRMAVYIVRKEDQDFPTKWLIPKGFEFPLKIKSRKGHQKEYHGGEDLTLLQFLEELAQKYEKDVKQAQVWADAFNGQAVDTVEELLKWETKDFDELKSVPRQVKIILQQELNKFKFKSMNEAGELNAAERKGIAHRIKRYLYYKAGEGDKLGYIDQEVLDLAFKEVRTYYEGDSLLEQIETFYLGYSVPMRKKGNIILERGMILYGPPGTGKTVLTDDLPLKIGLTPISHSLSASEVNRGIVGQTEKLLLDLCNRAAKMPHVLCCVSIDEVDSLVPKRDEKSSQHKTDGIAVLLAVIGGIKDVPNLVILASTNRLNQIDDAIKRRLSGQFFVGRPSPASRRKMIERVNKEKNNDGTDLIIMNENEIQETVKMTTNFSGAALKMLVSKLLVYYKTQKKSGKLDLGEIIKYATLTSKQFSIKLGTFYLPELFQKRITNSKQGIKEELMIQCSVNNPRFIKIGAGLSLEKMFLKTMKPKEIPNDIEASKYRHAFTGRIIVNLSDIMKTHIEYQLTKDLQLMIEERAVMSSTLNDLLPRFSDFVAERNIDYIQLFNSDFLLDNNAFDESKIMENINEKLQELGAYDRSLLIIDMDSLCGVNISKSESGMGPSLSYSLSNGKLFNFGIHAMNTKVQMTETKEIWIALACKNPYLLSIAKNSLNWRKTPEQIHNDNLEEENNTREKLCKRCNQKYLEVDNKLGACSYHDGFLFESAKPQARWVALTDEAMINSLKAHPKVNDFALKYICCLEGLNSQGCKKEKHSQQDLHVTSYYERFTLLKKSKK